MRNASFLVALMLLAACTKVSGPGTGPGPVSSEEATSSDPQKLSYPEVLVMALNENHDAEFELGAMFHDGDGIEQDYAKALEWYTKAATAGNRQAAFNLALMYRNGEGTEVNLDAARRLFTQASDAGDVRAAFHLGQLSYTGQGMPQDFAKALQYYLKSAKGGFADAQMNAGVMYVRGEGITEPNVIEAYAWLKIAADGGNERAELLLISLGDKITEEQKAEGEKRAEALMAEMRKNAGPNAS